MLSSSQATKMEVLMRQAVVQPSTKPISSKATVSLFANPTVVLTHFSPTFSRAVDRAHAPQAQDPEPAAQSASPLVCNLAQHIAAEHTTTRRDLDSSDPWSPRNGPFSDSYLTPTLTQLEDEDLPATKSPYRSKLPMQFIYRSNTVSPAISQCTVQHLPGPSMAQEALDVVEKDGVDEQRNSICQHLKLKCVLMCLGVIAAVAVVVYMHIYIGLWNSQ